MLQSQQQARIARLLFRQILLAAPLTAHIAPTDVLAQDIGAVGRLSVVTEVSQHLLPVTRFDRPSSHGAPPLNGEQTTLYRRGHRCTRLTIIISRIGEKRQAKRQNVFGLRSRLTRAEVPGRIQSRGKNTSACRRFQRLPISNATPRRILNAILDRSSGP